MKHRSWTTAGVAALTVLCAMAGSAMADSQLRGTVSGQLAQHNITVAGFDALTDTQVSQIALILNTSSSPAETEALITSVLAKDETCIGNDQLRANVKKQLAEHQIEVKNFDRISGTELVVIETILNSQEPNTSKQAQVEKIFAIVTPAVAGDYLKSDVGRCVRELDAKVDIDKLTGDQMLQIQLVAGGSESADTKRAMIEKIAAQK